MTKHILVYLVHIVLTDKRSKKSTPDKTDLISGIPEPYAKTLNFSQTKVAIHDANKDTRRSIGKFSPKYFIFSPNSVNDILFKERHKRVTIEESRTINRYILKS